MIKYLVDDTIKQVTAIPTVDGISGNISSLAFVIGSGSIYFSKLKIEYGGYA